MFRSYRFICYKELYRSVIKKIGFLEIKLVDGKYEKCTCVFNTTHTLENKIVLKVKQKHNSRLARLFAYETIIPSTSFPRIFAYGVLKYSRRFAATLDNLHEITLTIASG